MKINKHFLDGIFCFLLLPLGLRVIDVLSFFKVAKLIDSKPFHPNIKYKMSVFIIATIVYMVAIMISDLVNGASYSDTVESLAIPLLTLLSVQYILLKNFSPNQYFNFCMGGVCSQVFSLFLFSPGDFASNPLKFGLLKGLTFLILFLLYLKRSSNYTYLITVLALGSIGAVYFESRNALLISFFAVMVNFLPASFQLNVSSAKYSISKFLKFSCTLIILFMILNSSGQLLARFLQNFSEETYFVEKTLFQARSNLGLILSSRSEFLSSIPAFMDSPVIGHGSNPRDTDNKYLAYRLELRQSASSVMEILDKVIRQNKGYFNYITAHSHIFQGMVNTGIFGFYYWAVIIYLIATGCFQHRENHRFFTTFLAINLLFDIFFSPFGVNSRFYILLLLPYFINPGFYPVKPVLASGIPNH